MTLLEIIRSRYGFERINGKLWMEVNTRSQVENFSQLVRDYLGLGVNAPNWNNRPWLERERVEWLEATYKISDGLRDEKEWINSVRYRVKLKSVFRLMPRRPRCRICGARPSKWLQTDHSRTKAAYGNRKGWDCTGRPSHRARKENDAWAEREEEKWERKKQLSLLALGKATRMLLVDLTKHPASLQISTERIAVLLRHVLRVVEIH